MYLKSARAFYRNTQNSFQSSFQQFFRIPSEITTYREDFSHDFLAVMAAYRIPKVIRLNEIPGRNLGRISAKKFLKELLERSGVKHHYFHVQTISNLTFRFIFRYNQLILCISLISSISN